MISIVIPTLNESLNIEKNCFLIAEILKGIDYEIIFVDDMSTDGTYEICQSIGYKNPVVRSILRHGRKGLSSAVIEGILSSRYNIVCVVDADLQYDLSPLREAFLSCASGYDIVVLTRDMLDKNVITDLPRHRRFLTNLSSIIMKRLVPYDLRDPSSGFFVAKKSVFIDNLGLISAIGWKLLLDILMSVKGLSIAEVKTTFNSRLIGNSKLNASVFIDLFEMLINKLTKSPVMGSFILYAMCGIIGIIFLFITELFLLNQSDSHKLPLTISAIISMFFNYFLNNTITFRANKISRLMTTTALPKYLFICSLGLIINFAIIDLLGGIGFINLAMSTFVAGVWNFFLSRWFVWGVK